VWLQGDRGETRGCQCQVEMRAMCAGVSSPSDSRTGSSPSRDTVSAALTRQSPYHLFPLLRETETETDRETRERRTVLQARRCRIGLLSRRAQLRPHRFDILPRHALQTPFLLLHHHLNPRQPGSGTYASDFVRFDCVAVARGAAWAHGDGLCTIALCEQGDTALQPLWARVSTVTHRQRCIYQDREMI
jgi:hypothetical protein